MFGTVAYLPRTEGVTAVKLASELLNGQKIANPAMTEADINPYLVLSKKNIATFRPQW
jgi:hypothetical protein